jgi:hypothetical protein
VVVCHSHWIQPKLGFMVVALDVNISRLTAVEGPEMKSVGADSQGGWHNFSLDVFDYRLAAQVGQTL